MHRQDPPDPPARAEGHPGAVQDWDWVEVVVVVVEGRRGGGKGQGGSLWSLRADLDSEGPG